MVTTNIGKIFLQAYNVKYEKNYTAKDFFDKVFFPLVLDSPKYLQWVQNSPFVQKSKESELKLLQVGSVRKDYLSFIKKFLWGVEMQVWL